ncbi:D-alanyl-D-alanine carboxypeptidase [bacterium]|nr:D-alanyl-D-alanine carboxypeptidase [bacterium]
MHFRFPFFSFFFSILVFYFTFTVGTQPSALPAPNSEPSAYKITKPCPFLTQSLINTLKDSSRLVNQGLLFESLDGSIEIASLNPDLSFNPASGLKLLVTLSALDKWGPDYSFRTTFYADGSIDAQDGVLNGNLCLFSEGDPTFRKSTNRQLIRKLRKNGISRVTGNLCIDGLFSLDSDWSEEQSAQRLRRDLQRAGIRISGQTYWETSRGKPLVSYYSAPLLDILYFMNAHSVNWLAERLGTAIGGTEMLTLELVKNYGIDLNDILITRPSGLDFNRISPPAMLRVLRELHQRCDNLHIDIAELLPVAGLDHSTLSHRFRNEAYRGCITGKTGTLCQTDNGVSTLSGFINTREYGMLVFTIFNSNGDVLTFKRWQDKFLRHIMDESGGAKPFRNASHPGIAIYQSGEFINHTELTLVTFN